MAFTGIVVTKRGQEALAKAQNEGKLKITGVAVGDGRYDGACEDAEALANQLTVLDVLTVDTQGNECTLEADLSNAELEEGYYLREIGIMAQAGDDQVLYAYAYAGEDAEYIPAKGSVTVEKRFAITLIVDGVESVTVERKSVLYLTQQEYERGVGVVKAVWLSDLDWLSATQDFEITNKDRNCKGENITMRDCEGNAYVCSKGIGTHANSEIQYALAPGTYDAFEALIGVNADGDAYYCHGIKFRVYCDTPSGETELYRDDNEVFTFATPARYIHVDIPDNATKLRLYVVAVSDTGAAWANWGDAKLISYPSSGCSLENQILDLSRSKLDAKRYDAELGKIEDKIREAAENLQGEVDEVEDKIREAAENLQSEVDELKTNPSVPVAAANKLSHGYYIDGAAFDGTKHVFHQGGCSDGADVKNKVVSIPDLHLVFGTKITVRFENGNTAENPTLNLNNSGAYPIIYKGKNVPPGYILPESVIELVYTNNREWIIVGDLAQAQLDELYKLLWKECDRGDLSNYNTYNNELWSYYSPENIDKTSCSGHSCAILSLYPGTYKIVCETPKNVQSDMQFALIKVADVDRKPYAAASTLMQGGTHILKCDSVGYFLANSTLESGLKIYKCNF